MANNKKNKFNPDSSGYDYESARKYGIKQTLEVNGKAEFQKQAFF